MKIGIVGLPNVGKSTLFNALTKSYAAEAQNFPFCTINPNIGIVDVKDERIDNLAEMCGCKKKVYAAIEFVDIAGLVKGASKGEGLGNKFLSHIREVDAIVQVLRHFPDSDITHVEGSVDPMRDVEIINYELMFSDLEQISSKLPNLMKRAKLSSNKDDKKEALILEKIETALKEGKMAHSIGLTPDETKTIKSYNLLTIKPIVYAINISQDDIENSEAIKKEFEEKLNSPVAIVCAKLESELMEMSDEEKKTFVTELLAIDHVKKLPLLNDLISLAYKQVGLMYYFTSGEKETRAWTIPIGATAPQAAGAIHTDFERGFIKAEIVSYNDLMKNGSRSKAREAGSLKLEGKEYIMKDGDVVIFKFNV